MNKIMYNKNLICLKQNYCYFLKSFYSTIDINKVSYNFWKNSQSNLEYMVGILDINLEDLNHTISILDKYKSYIIKTNKKVKVLELGAGIGRVTNNCLVKYFNNIDLVEINSDYCKVVEEDLKKLNNLRFNVYNYSIEEFSDYILKYSKTNITNVSKNLKYDLIYCQWVLEYVYEKHLKLIFEMFERLLTKEGVIIIKENIDNENYYIENQGAFIRTRDIYDKLISKYNLKIIESNVVNISDKEIIPIRYWVISN